MIEETDRTRIEDGFRRRRADGSGKDKAAAAGIAHEGELVAFGRESDGAVDIGDEGGRWEIADYWKSEEFADKSLLVGFDFVDGAAVGRKGEAVVADGGGRGCGFRRRSGRAV